MQQTTLIINAKKIFVFIFCYLSIFVQAADKPTHIAIDVGESKDDISIYRFGLQKDFSDWLKENNIPLGGYFEGSLNYWDGGKDKSYGVALSPVFFYQFCADCTLSPYIEGGIGGSLFTKKTFNDEETSSLFKFEDRIGVGMKIGHFDYHIRYMHYSNGGLKKPNDGMDIYTAGISYKF